MADIARQRLEPASETGAIQAERAKAMGEVAGVADHLVQQLDDLVGRRGRTGFSLRRQTSGERCGQRRERCAREPPEAPSVRQAAAVNSDSHGDPLQERPARTWTRSIVL